MFVFLLLVTIGFSYYTMFICPVIVRVSQEEVKGLSMLSVNKAAHEAVTDAYTYDDMIEIMIDDSGDVKLIKANVMVINILARIVADKSQIYLNSIGQQVISIAYGTLSGLSILSGLGPCLTLNVLPVGVVSTKIYSSFYSAGINQTIHQITLNVIADVEVVLPGLNSSVSVEVPIIIAENVIVGKIPEIYLNSNDLDTMLNLLP